MTRAQRLVIALQVAAYVATIVTIARLAAPVFLPPPEGGFDSRGMLLLALTVVLVPTVIVVILVTGMLVAGLMRWRLGSRWMLIAADLPIPIAFVAIELTVDPGGLDDLFQTAPWLAIAPALFLLALVVTTFVAPPVLPRAPPGVALR